MLREPEVVYLKGLILQTSTLGPRVSIWSREKLPGFLSGSSTDVADYKLQDSLRGTSLPELCA